MNRILVTGHSLINARQYKLFEEMAEQYPELEILVLPPDRWRDETIKPFKKNNFEIKPLKYLGTNFNFARYWLDGLENEIEKFNPSVIYIEQEPFSLFTNTLIKLIRATNPKIRVALFTWENKYSMFEYYSHYGYGDVWKYCLENSDMVVCGNKLAEEVSKKICPNVKTSICPQTGIDPIIYRPKKTEETVYNTEREYDIGIGGRLVEEKGVKFAENLAKEMKLKMLWIGGRGDFNPSYGDFKGWIHSYVDIPKEFYQKVKIVLALTYNYNSYKEQFCYQIGEAMACGNPVITSTNGSIPDVYKGSPAVIIPQEDIAKGDFSKIQPILQTLLEDEKERKKLGREGRKWILKNLSCRMVGHRLYEIFKSI